jgi:hypothetical protein
MIRSLILFSLLIFAGADCAQAMNQSNTLAANDAIANELIEAQVDEETARVLLETPYKGFYQIESKIRKRQITFGEVVPQQSWPDDRWGLMARDIASLIEIPAYHTGSRIEPKATAYVVFYDIYMPGLDHSKVMLLPTTSNAKPNTLAVLVVKHQNHYRARSIKGTLTGSADQNGNLIYFFELAM